MGTIKNLESYSFLVDKHKQAELLLVEVKRARMSLDSDYVNSMLTLYAANRLADELGLPCAPAAREEFQSACAYNAASRTGYLLMDRLAAPLEAESESELEGIFDDAYASLKRGERQYNALVLMHSAFMTALKKNWQCGRQMQQAINRFYSSAGSRGINELLLSPNDMQAYRSLRARINGSDVDDRLDEP